MQYSKAIEPCWLILFAVLSPRTTRRTYQLSQVVPRSLTPYSQVTNAHKGGNREERLTAKATGLLLAPGAYLRDEGMQPGEKRLAEQPEHRVEGNDDLLRDRSCYCGPVGPRQVQADKKSGCTCRGLLSECCSAQLLINQ